MTSTATMSAWGDMSPGQLTAAMTSSPTILIAHLMVLKSCKTLSGRSKFQAKVKQLRKVIKPEILVITFSSKWVIGLIICQIYENIKQALSVSTQYR